LDDIVSAFPGEMGAVVKMLPDGEAVMRAETRVWPAASTIKVPILVHLLQRAAAGSFDLEERLPIPKGPRVEGSSGVLQELESVHALSVRDLATLMIVVSDNLATNVLLDRLGGPAAVQESVESWRLPDTRIQRRMMDFEAARRGRENLTTPRDLAALFEGLARGSLLGPSETAFALGALGAVQDLAGLRRGIPEETRVEHKTGDLPGAYAHDAGLVRAARGTVLVCAMTHGPSVAEGYDAVAALGRAVWTHLAR
jgi:beta-lactamase class A